MLYPYNGVLVGNKKEWNTDICYYMDKLVNVMLSNRTQLYMST